MSRLCYHWAKWTGPINLRRV